jgi:hypothetical protein
MQIGMADYRTEVGISSPRGPEKGFGRRWDPKVAAEPLFWSTFLQSLEILLLSVLPKRTGMTKQPPEALSFAAIRYND